jgi:hypothetical protein
MMTKRKKKPRPFHKKFSTKNNSIENLSDGLKSNLTYLRNKRIMTQLK